MYARFSSDNQREESIEAQLRAMHDYCQRNSIYIIHEYCDRAKSATTDDRPEFLQMINDSKKKEFNYVIVHKLDRFSRNRYDSAIYQKELKRNGVEVVSVLEQFDDSPESIILQSVLEGMAEYYSKNLSREVMKGMRESALKCQALGGKPPFGYKVNPETRKYEIEESEAEAVKIIFNRVVEGVGYNEIITELNQLGYRTRNGNPFGKNSLSAIIRNEKYRGVYIFNRAVSRNAEGRRNNHKNKPEDEMIRIENGMPRIIDDETFEKVNAILKGRTHNAPYKKAKETYYLTGKIFCGVCGSSYTGTRHRCGQNKNLLVTYRCGKKNNHGDFRCKNKDVNRNYVERFVFDTIEKIVFDVSRIQRLVKRYNECLNELNTDVNKRISKLHSNLKSINQKIDNIVGVIASTGSQALLDTLDNLEKEKQELVLKIKAEEQSSNSRTLSYKDIAEAMKRAQKMFRDGSLPEKKQLVNLYLNKVTVYPEHVEIVFNHVPQNLIPFASQSQVRPADEGEPCDVHKLILTAKIKEAPTPKLEWTRFPL